MSKIKIEKNIPIPRKNTNLQLDLLNKTLDRMKVGESFVVTGNTARAQVVNRMRNRNIPFVSRCINKPITYQPSTYEYRIWKTNKQ
jgi:hypothetical protein